MKSLMLLGALVGSGVLPSRLEGEVLPLTLYAGKQFTVQATVAGKARVFLFDTGEGTTMISPALAGELKCEPWGNVTAFRMLGERLDVKRCDDVPFGIGKTRYVGPSVIVYDLGEIAGKDAPPIDGAIGLDLFAGRTITLQLARRRLIIETASSVQARIRTAVEVPLRLSRPDGLALDVNLGVRTPRGLAWMELDTGNAGPTIFVSPAIAPLLNLSSSTREAQDVTIRLGDVRIRTRARVFPDMIIDGNIGMQLVRDRDITLDLKAGRAWLGPAPPAS